VRLANPPARGLRDRHRTPGFVLLIVAYCAFSGYQLVAGEWGRRAGVEAGLLMFTWVALLGALARWAPDFLDDWAHRWRGAIPLIAVVGLMAALALFIAP
jgi:drug/metabolite transporter (DMT)-like permease